MLKSEHYNVKAVWGIQRERERELSAKRYIRFI